LCAANPRSRKATISSFFKSLALRFSFSVCCRTCLRVLFREGLVVLRVASVTLYDAGDADIFSLCGGGMFETNAKGESEFWRVALFRCLEKVKTLPVLPETVFALLLLLLFLLNVSCSSLFALLQNGLRDRQHRISANFFPVSCPYKSWPKSVNFGQLFETLNPKKLAEIG